MRGPTSRFLRALEWALLGAGAACVVWYVGVRAAAEFVHARQRATLERTIVARTLPGDEERIPAPGPAPDPGLIGELEIPRLGVSGTVMAGDDDGVLRVAIGYLSGTPPPWQDGNSAFAGHRDSIFRPLRDIRIGDDIRLATPHGEFRYRVRRTLVVDPEEIWVLGPVPRVNLTLITCFPFSYIGHAPRRFVVQAEKIQSAGP
ncbi:MAG: class D sortase [Acidobacteriia bacterium]|nr:class D sortase [Terriglobia bacterium]